MFKLVHLITGVAALLLSFIPSLREGSQPYLHHADAIALALAGLLNLAIAPRLPSWHQGLRKPLQTLASLLLLTAVAVLTVALLAELPLIGAGLLLLVAATLLHLFVNLQLDSRPASQGSAILQAGREAGVVKWFNTSKGFGFISRDSGDDIFVHFRAIRGEGHRVLVEGQRVEFSVVERDKGLQAEDVVPSPSYR